MHTTQLESSDAENDKSTEEWLNSGSRWFFMLLAFGSLALGIWWHKLGPWFGYSHHPIRAGFAIGLFFILGLMISLADDGGIGEGCP
jgi:hypothetical protein